MLTDHTFRIPAIRWPRRSSPHQPNVRMYLFTFASTAFGGVLGSCHALEVPFVWDNLDAQGAAMFVGDVGAAHRRAGPADGRRVDLVRPGRQSVGRKVCRTGRPTTPSAAPPCDSTSTTVEVLDDPMPTEREVWTGIEL